MGALTFDTFSTKRQLLEAPMQLWKSAVLIRAEVSSGASLALKGASGDAELLLTRLNSTTLADSAVRKDVSKSIRNLRLPRTFSELGPIGKIS